MNAPTRRPGPPTEPPAAKRQRKAINCEPCRASKLKCDRNRPCSSCVLRGTTAQCYQGADAALYRPAPASFTQPATVSPTLPSSAPSTNVPIDATYHIKQIHQSLSALEAHLAANSTTPGTADVKGKGKEPERQLESLGRPLGNAGGEGLYAGPTTSIAFLMPGGNSTNFSDGSSTASVERSRQTRPPTYEIDFDLRRELPHLSVADGLIDFYFDYCSWLWKHIDRIAFTTRWQEYKSSPSTSYDRTLLAAQAIICAIAIHYLPPHHELVKGLHLFYESDDDETGRRGSSGSLRGAESEQHGASVKNRMDELGIRWYNVCRAALSREQAERRMYTLDVVEILLARCHYLTTTKIDTEEVWSVRGELVTMATAMGLHRDPGGKAPAYIAERRRWAWYHVLVVERWQAFVQGRPIAISPDHYDTKLPSSEPTLLLSSRPSNGHLAHLSPSQIDTSPPSPPRLLRTPESIASTNSTERMQSDVTASNERQVDGDEHDEGGKRTYEAHIEMFRMGIILGDIMDDAVRLKPVSYERVLKHDGAIGEWFENLPDGMKLPPMQIAQDLASFSTGLRRRGVQAFVLRLAALHIRFTLHRPYAAQAASTLPSQLSNTRHVDSEATDDGSNSLAAQSSQAKDSRIFSLIAALEATKEMIDLVSTVAAPGNVQFEAPSVPGHLTWTPLHVFSVTMFLIFTIINSPVPNSDSQTNGPRHPTNEMDIDRNTYPALFDARTRIPFIHRAIDILRRVSIFPASKQAVAVLEALAPLYGIDYISASLSERERMKRDVLPRVRSMGMPYHEGGSLNAEGAEGNAERFRRTRTGSSASSHTLPPFNSLAISSDQRQYSDGRRSSDTRRIPTPGATPPPSGSSFTQDNLHRTGTHIRDQTVRTGDSSVRRYEAHNPGSNEHDGQEMREAGAAGGGTRIPGRRMSGALARPEPSDPSSSRVYVSQGGYVEPSAGHVQSHATQTNRGWDGSYSIPQISSIFSHDGVGPNAPRALPPLIRDQARRESAHDNASSRVASYSQPGIDPAYSLSNNFGNFDEQYAAHPPPSWALNLPRIESSVYGSNVWPPQQTQATGWVVPSMNEYTPSAQYGAFGNGLPGLSGMQSFPGFAFPDAEMELMLGDQQTSTADAAPFGGVYAGSAAAFSSGGFPHSFNGV